MITELTTTLLPDGSIVYAILLCINLTGVFAFVGFAYPTHKVLPEAYYRLKNPQMLQKVYHLMGISYFRKFLMVIFWGNKNNRKKYFDGTRTGFKNFIYQTKQSEFGHLGAVITIQIVALILAFKGLWLMVVVMSTLNLIGNFYPILMQRYHRFRIEQIVRRFNLSVDK